LQPVVAYYQPYSIDRKLSVPFYALLSRRTGARAEQAADGREIHQIGAWLPELEFTHYFPTQHWRTLIDSCDYHVAVSGTSLASFPFASSGIPFVSWVATPWREDRRHRERELPLPRRILDFFMVRPLTQALERRLLKRGTLLALSDYTRLRLNALAGRNVIKSHANAH
jgi:hypothetical protein